MSQDSMTAKTCAFSRAYHTRFEGGLVFRDEAAEPLLGQEDFEAQMAAWADGVGFFLPGFQGSQEEGLRRIVDGFLAPSVLGRSAFAEAALSREVDLGCRQYVIFGAGYDTFAWRKAVPALTVYELDEPGTAAARQHRLEEAGLAMLTPCRTVPCDLTAEAWPAALGAAGFSPERKSFGSLLGLVYYLTPEAFDALLGRIAPLWCPGSALVLDYPRIEEADPMETSGSEVGGETGGEAPDNGASALNRRLAAGAGEAMKAAYTEREMASLLEKHGFLIYEALDDKAMTDRFFKAYNAASPSFPMRAPAGVGYLLAVRRERRP